MNAQSANRSRRLGRWYTPLLLVPIPVLILLATLRPTVVADAVPETACVAGGQPERRAVYLVDLRKPLPAAHAQRPGELLDVVSDDADAGTEIAVYALSRYPEAPRTLLGRLCKPHDNGDLMLASAKDGNGGARDCDDLPAAVAGLLRGGPAEFCAERRALRGRIDALARSAPGTATDAHLVEALDEVRRDFADAGVPTSLYVFSDMMQHAKWYSHLDAAPEQWDFEAFAQARAAELAASGRREHPADGLAVKVFYVPRSGITDREPVRLAHQGFWTRHLDGAAMAFEPAPTMPAYPAERLVYVPTPAELAAYELERARHQAELAERERAALAESRRALERDRGRLEERDRALADGERRLAEREREVAAREQAAEPIEVAGDGGQQTAPDTAQGLPSTEPSKDSGGELQFQEGVG